MYVVPSRSCARMRCDDYAHAARTVSGEALSVYNLIGAGIMWVTSLGAICSRTLQPGEQWIGALFRCFVPGRLWH